MRLLLVHNFYASSTPSGENQVFHAERKMLADRGHSVSTFTRHSDEIRQQGMWGLVRGALATPWNPWTTSEVNRVNDQAKPDLIHIHNTFPLISPSIFHAVGRRAARVLTLHNYRLFCPAAIPLRAGKVCTECMDQRSVFPALRHACYRGSRAATFPLAINVALHRWLGTWRDEVDAFIALSDFQKQKMAEAGLPVHKIHVKPNFYPGSPTVVPWAERENYVVFVGRLSAEKGINTLVDAWRQWGPSAPVLRVVGDGPLRAELEAKASGLPVTFLGQLAADQAQAQIARANLLILPSECFEGFPMVVREAFAFGTPAAVSSIGPLPSVVSHGENGVVFPVSNPGGLVSAVQRAWDRPDELKRLGGNARLAFEALYTESANYEALINIYRFARAGKESA